MKIAVLGLWHLGSVTAAGAAAAGHDVVGWDRDPAAVAALAAGRPPLLEPGLDERLREGLAAGRLRFEPDLRRAVAGAEVIWGAHDVPVDEQDQADPEAVLDDLRQAAALAEPGALVLISAQLPAGTARALAAQAAAAGRADLEFACSPENLRLGQALKVFSQPDRVVCGVTSPRGRAILEKLWAPVTSKIEWMGLESAETTKHAVNAFLAVSAAFANELAAVCEIVGADAKEVERGLKTESRIGPGAYLGPGPAFAGGTLARDVAYLAELGRRAGFVPLVVEAAKRSNDRHKDWLIDRLVSRLGEVRDHKIALWGLTYKPGTSALRRSGALEDAWRLSALGARLTAFDPAVSELPPEWDGRLELAASPLAAATGASALAVTTPWPDFLAVGAQAAAAVMSRPLVLDPTGFLRGSLSPQVEYVSVGYAVGPAGSGGPARREGEKA
jgi:UDPglucose 6-dehydrogenase